MQAALGTHGARGGDGAAQPTRAVKIANTTGVIVVNHFGKKFYLVVEEDRNDWSKCPRSLRTAWEAAFRDNKAPHTVYFWTGADRESLRNSSWRVEGDVNVTLLGVLTCIAKHMISKGWIPKWAPATITKNSTWQEVQALPIEFYVMLSNTLELFTKMIPWALTFPAERLEPGEKSALANGAGEEILSQVADRANKEEACVLPVESCEEAQFLLQRKRKPGDPDKYTYVQERNVNPDESRTYGTVVMRTFAERANDSDWRCAHGIHKYFPSLINGFDVDAYEKRVKAFHETWKPRLMHADQIRACGDKKTVAALDALENGRALKKRRVE